LGRVFGPDNGSNMFFPNVGTCKHYVVQKPERRPSLDFPNRWVTLELEVPQMNEGAIPKFFVIIHYELLIFAGKNILLIKEYIRLLL
jgi:hypothetical protein